MLVLELVSPGAGEVLQLELRSMVVISGELLLFGALSGLAIEELVSESGVRS